MTENIVNDHLIQNCTVEKQDVATCKNFSYTCLINEIEIDRANVPEELFEFLDFNDNILMITKEFWENMAKMVNIEGNIYDPQKCFSFINPENCKTISKFSFNPYTSFVKLQVQYDNVKRGNNLLKLKKESLVLLKFYLNEILPIFDQEIDKLEISIVSYDENDNHETVLYKYLNSEQNIEIHIIRYLKDMRKFVSDFNIRSSDGNEPAIKRILKRALKKTYDNVASRISSLETVSTSSNLSRSIQQEVTASFNVPETTHQLGCDDFNFTTIPSNNEIISSSNAFLTDNTALASINLHPVMAIGAILFVILGTVIGLVFLRRKRFNNQNKINNDYDLVYNL